MPPATLDDVVHVDGWRIAKDNNLFQAGAISAGRGATPGDTRAMHAARRARGDEFVGRGGVGCGRLAHSE